MAGHVGYRTKVLLELASLDENQPVARGAVLMVARNISVIGVRHAGLVAGWVQFRLTGTKRVTLRPPLVFSESAVAGNGRSGSFDIPSGLPSAKSRANG
jgi:hypothetical protein